MYKLFFASTIIALLIIIPVFASGEVYIPDHEYVGFYDHDGVYTVIGGVKNNEMRKILKSGTVLPETITRPEVSRILIDYYRSL